MVFLYALGERLCSSVLSVECIQDRLHIVDFFFFFFQAEDGIRDLVRSRGLGDVYKRQVERIQSP